MAEQTNTNTETTVVESENTTEINTPTIEELMAQISEARAENAKQKAALDKALKEKGDLTKSLRAKQSADEIADEERRTAEEKIKAENESIRAELNLIKAQKAYSGTFAEEKTIDSLIDAINDKDHNAIAVIFNKVLKESVEKAVKEEKAKWLKERPQPNAGGQYSSMTKEQIMAIPDREERRKAIAQNMDKF